MTRRHLSAAARIDPTNRRNGSALVEPNSADGVHVCDDFGETVPVSIRELEVIETYLAALLDALLKGEE